MGVVPLDSPAFESRVLVEAVPAVVVRAGWAPVPVCRLCLHILYFGRGYAVEYESGLGGRRSGCFSRERQRHDHFAVVPGDLIRADLRRPIAGLGDGCVDFRLESQALVGRQALDLAAAVGAPMASDEATKAAPPAKDAAEKRMDLPTVPFPFGR